jgi:hypothetical protein
VERAQEREEEGGRGGEENVFGGTGDVAHLVTHLVTQAQMTCRLCKLSLATGMNLCALCWACQAGQRKWSRGGSHMHALHPIGLRVSHAGSLFPTYWIAVLVHGVRYPLLYRQVTDILI